MSCASCDKEGAKHRCEFCRQAVYCGERCQTEHWANHESECTIVNVPERNMTAFVPYFGEDDDVSPEIADRIDPNGAAFQTYIVNHWDPSGKVYTHLVEPLIEDNVSFTQWGKKQGYGANPGSLGGLKYNLIVDMWPEVGAPPVTATLEGLSVADTTIYRGATNKTGQLAKMNLVRGLKRDTTKLVFWPGTEELMNALGTRFEIPKSGAAIRVRMVLENGIEVTNIHGILCFGTVSYLRRGLKSLFPFQSEFRQKLGKKAAGSIKANPENLFMLRGVHKDTGDSMQMIFEAGRGKDEKTVELLDIEIRIRLRRFQRLVLDGAKFDELQDRPPPPPPVEDSGMEFQLDANNADHINGLIMRLQDLIAEGELEDFDREFALLEDHREKLEDSIAKGDTEYEASPKINATVEHATQLCWKHLDLGIGQYKVLMPGYITRKLQGGSANAIIFANKLASDMYNVRMGPQTRTTRIRKGLINRSIKNLKAAIDKKRKDLDIPEEAQNNYNRALIILNGIATSTTV